jgi:hypothetical protein
MASINIAGDTSGTLTLSAPLVAGSNVATLPAATGELSMLGGAGQTLQLFTVGVTRISGTTYTNTTGKPIAVYINVSISAGAYSFVVDGNVVSTNNASGGSFQINWIIPNGSTYAMTFSTVGTTRWYELR